MNQTRLILTRLSQSSSSSTSTSSSSTFRNVSRTFRNTFCTATAAAAVTTKPKQPSKNVSLYSKITPLGNPNDVITPVLDDWVNQGNSVNPTDLRFIVNDLRYNGRFTHALEVSRWMSDKRLIEFTAKDAAVRLDLIGKAYGVEEAEKYFNGIPENFRNSQVYSTLLHCFAYAKCVEKAEAVMQKMKELGFASYSVPYNAMLNLHCRTHNGDKVAAVLFDMEANNIKYDSYTYSILMNTYGGDGDIDKLESVLTKMESDPELNIDWMAYAVAAKHYIGAQLGEKALESLIKSEKLVKLSKQKNEAYTIILNLYAILGKKDEVLRVWEECKKCNANNKDYGSVIRVLLKFNDVETAEKIFKEWEDNKLFKDIRIPNLLIDMYCENGVIEKAEALVEKLKSEKWQNPNSSTWSWMTSGYVKSNMMDKAVEAMKSAISEPMPPICWKSKRENLLACLKYLKDKEDSEQLNAVIDTLKEKCLITADVVDKLVEYLSGKCDIEDVLKAGDEEETANK